MEILLLVRFFPAFHVPAVFHSSEPRLELWPLPVELRQNAQAGQADRSVNEELHRASGRSDQLRAD